MTTYVLANVYDEASNLPRMWESARIVRGEVVLVAVDGKYPDFGGEHDLSADGTREFVKEHGHLIDCVDYECEKRTAGLRFIDTVASEGDFVLYLDADEALLEFHGFPDRVGYFTFTRHSNPAIQYGRCRMYRWEPGLEFRHRHYDLYLGDDLVSSLESAPDFDVVGTGIHFDRSHDPERSARKKPYYKLLRQREKHPAEVPA